MRTDGEERQRAFTRRRLKFRARQLIPDATDDHDLVGAPGLSIDANDIPRIERVESCGTFTGDHQGITAREIAARVAVRPDSDATSLLVHPHDGQAILLPPVGQAL